MTLETFLPSGRRLFAAVDPSAAAVSQDWFRRLQVPADTLTSDARLDVELDWAVFRLEAHGDRITVFEPDYSSPDLARFVSGAVISCRIFSAQEKLVGTLQMKPEALTPSQYVRVALAALAETSTFGYRVEESSHEFTGWEITAALTKPGDAFGQFTVRELAHARPAWLVALCLPVHCAFRYVGNTLIEVLDPSGTTHPVMLSIDT